MNSGRITLVFLANIFDLQCPSARVLSVYAGESLVGRVGVGADGQYVQVALSDPGDLEAAKRDDETVIEMVKQLETFP